MQQTSARQPIIVGLVIAHPDDETMFFSPTLTAIKKSSKTQIGHGLTALLAGATQCHILCLSTGNAEGLGVTRHKEFISCVNNVFNIPTDCLEIIDDETQFPDKFELWPSHSVAKEVERFVEKRNINVLFTFDSSGVSKHPNHISCYHGVKLFAETTATSKYIEIFFLQSVGLVSKYFGIISSIWNCFMSEWKHVQYIAMELLDSVSVGLQNFLIQMYQAFISLGIHTAILTNDCIDYPRRSTYTPLFCSSLCMSLLTWQTCLPSTILHFLNKDAKYNNFLYMETTLCKYPLTINTTGNSSNSSITETDCNMIEKCAQTVNPSMPLSNASLCHEIDSRQKFRKYWEYAHQAFGATIAGMMLKPNVVSNFAMEDQHEISVWITDELNHKVVDIFLELGAGIGRLTPYLFPLCKKLIAVDFIETYIQINKEKHTVSTRPNDEFLCADATKLCYYPQSIDFIFWNWLLMYLSDKEVENFVCSCSKWLKPKGYLFCRESCMKPSNTSDRPWAIDGNPTKYRTGYYYTTLFMQNVYEKTGIQFRIVFMERPVSVYDKGTGNSGQLSWLLQRL